MKMTKLFLTFLFLAFSVIGSAQDIKLKKGIVSVDGTSWIKYDGCGGWDQLCSLSNLAGDEIIYMKLLTKPNSTEKYWKVSFLGAQMSLDIDFSEGFGNINSRLLKKFYDGKVVNEDGTLNDERVARMVEKYGSPYSNVVNAPSTIIINNNQEPQRSGINVNIGR